MHEAVTFDGVVGLVVSGGRAEVLAPLVSRGSPRGVPSWLEVVASVWAELYIRKVLRRFAMSDSHPVSTPVDHSIHLNPANENNWMNASLYQQAVGSIMYAAIGTRPDLAFAIQTLSQFNHDPSTEHWAAIKRVLWYLNGTLDLGITYDGASTNNPISVEGYSDSDWASNHINCCSISGYTFLMCGSTISWSSKKQLTVALSSMEGEYMAITHAWKQLKWHRDFWNTLGFPQITPSIIRIDNRAAILLANNPEHHNWSKHIDMHYHRIWDEITAGTVDLIWCPTDKEVADIFTKPLPPVKFIKFRAELGMHMHWGGVLESSVSLWNPNDAADSVAQPLSLATEFPSHCLCSSGGLLLLSIHVQ